MRDAGAVSQWEKQQSLSFSAPASLGKWLGVTLQLGDMWGVSPSRR